MIEKIGYTIVTILFAIFVAPTSYMLWVAFGVMALPYGKAQDQEIYIPKLQEFVNVQKWLYSLIVIIWETDN